MMRARIIYVLFGVFGVALAVDLKLEQDDSGFFLKPLSSKQNLFTTLNKHLIITRPVQQGTKVTASYGPFSASDEITPRVLLAGMGNRSEIVKHRVLDDLDVTVHIVTRTVTHDRPVLQALFHTSQLNQPTAASGAANGKQKNKKRRIMPRDALPLDQPEPKWCLQLHVEKLDEELRSSCLLDVVPGTCLSQVVIPSQWWLDQKPSVQVFFSVYPVSESLECSSASNSIVPSKTKPEETLDKVFVDSVSLLRGQLTYHEVREDQHILVYIPEKSFYPGSRFQVPVKLQAESDLQSFVVKARVRHGLRILGARASDEETWQVSLNMNHKQKGAMVTAFVKDKDNYAKTDKIQDIFHWSFEVEDDASGTEPGRISLSIEYEMHSNNKESYDVVQNRVVARVHIQSDNTYTIVPVIKTTELINTAVLTGTSLYYKLRIYAVSQAGKITDITDKTTCHSGDEEVLQVAQNCDVVFLDGRESKGSTSVSVIAKYGRHTKFLFFKVWFPQYPLDMELSDHKLSQIKGWKAPKYNQHISRKARGVDFGYLTHPGLLLHEEGAHKEDLSTTCHLRFQQSIVKIFARFCAPEGSKYAYMLGRRAALDVTDVVRDRLRIADTSIASLKGNVVSGLRPGRTEVQVVLVSGRVIGAREVKVGNDKVTIDQLEVSMVTGLSIHLEDGTDMPGTILAHTIVNQHLQKKYQEGFLDIAVRFSDDTSLPLRYIPISDYFLDMDTLNNHVVAFGPMMSPYRPKIIALGQGKGDLLKLSLELGDSCQRKKTRPLISRYVHIDIDFSKEGKDLKIQNDQLARYENSASGRVIKHDIQTEQGILQVSLDTSVKHGQTKLLQPLPKLPKQPIKEVNEKLSNIPLDEDLGNLPTATVSKDKESDSVAHHEAQQQHISEVGGMTPLEVGMYVLLAVFCLAIAVFTVNCVVFVVRYRKKRMPRDRRENISNAHDWVWIGRATLERNAVNTSCSKALMPEEDFNGNRNRAPPGQRGSNRNSACSGGSNRNSYVSTYKGSECSIRITSNPHPEANTATNQLEQQPEVDDEMEENGNGDKNGNTEPNPALPSTSQQQSATTASAPSSRPNSGVPVTNPSVRPQSGLLTVPAAGSRPSSSGRLSTGNTLASTSATNQVAQPLGGQLKKSSHLDIAWDYESMGMTYDQLMEYFDNLKESTA